MANKFAPFGFRHIGSREGVTPSMGRIPKSISNTNATPIFKGDPVVSLSTGSATQKLGQEYVAQATPGTTQIAGIFEACEYLSVSMRNAKQWSEYWPGNGDAILDPLCFIIGNGDGKFLVQGNGLITPAMIGLNANFAIGTGNKMTGTSGAYLDVTTVATTATLPFRIMDLCTTLTSPLNGGDPTTPFNCAIVAFNNVDSRAMTGI